MAGIQHMKQTCIGVCNKCVVSIKMCNKKHCIKDVVNTELIEHQRCEELIRTV